MKPLLRSALLFLALLGPLLPVRAHEEIDLSHTFPDAACRSQGGVGGCHAFGSTALLESAIFRRYGKIGKQKLKLSEADLFVRMAVADSRYLDPVKRALGESASGTGKVEFHEGQNTRNDLRFAVKHGVATDNTLPWHQFKWRYDEFRRKIKVKIEVAMQECGEALGKATALEEAGERATCLIMRREARDKVKDFLKELGRETCKEAEACLIGADPDIRLEREYVRKLIEDFTIHQDSYWLLEPPKRDDPVKCAKHGRNRRDELIKHLRRGIPVGVSMNITGLPEWSTLEAKEDSFHAFVITGFELTGLRDETAVFKTRNSWGGHNPNVNEDRLCRVNYLFYVFTDKE